MATVQLKTPSPNKRLLTKLLTDCSPQLGTRDFEIFIVLISVSCSSSFYVNGLLYKVAHCPKNISVKALLDTNI